MRSAPLSIAAKNVHWRKEVNHTTPLFSTIPFIGTDVRSAPPISCYCRQECPGKYQDVHTCMNQLISPYGSTLNPILGEKKSLCARKMLKEKQIIVSRRSDKGNNLRDRAGKQGMEGQFRSSASDAHHQPPSTPSLANYLPPRNVPEISRRE